RDAGDAGAPRAVATSAVRMTFQAEQPFFPYREPEDQRVGLAELRHPRLLRVYFVGAGKVAGARGAKREAWPGTVAWANQLPEGDRDRLFELLKVTAPVGPLWLTEFEDRSSPRPGTDDVFFSPAADPDPVSRPPVIHSVFEDVVEGVGM